MMEFREMHSQSLAKQHIGALTGNAADVSHGAKSCLAGL